MSDDHKQHILDTLNHFRQSARSINSIPIGIRDIQGYAKENFGMKQPEVAASLDYLIQHNWVAEIKEERTFTRGGTTIPTSQSKYKLSATGISQFDSDSRFNSLNRYSGINVENIGGVVVIGNNNVVNNKYRDLYTHLDTLEKKIKLSEQPDSDKLDASADIQTIKDQLSKEAPNKSIVSTAMGVVRAAADAAGAIDLWEKALEVIQNIL